MFAELLGNHGQSFVKLSSAVYLSLIHIYANRRVVQSGVNVGEEIWEKEARKIPWVFVPYNFEVDSRAKRIMQQLRSEKIGIETVDDIELVWQTANPYIKRKIKNIFGERQEANINSMTLFSGETAGVMRQTMCSEKDNMPSGCLYTGDRCV